MSGWVERILREFSEDLSRFWIARDPDGLLLDERLLHALRQRGFEVLPFEDSVAFRTEYEERYRSSWDAGEDGSAKSLVLQLLSGDSNILPYDYQRIGREVKLSLADLFPKLSYSMIRLLGTEHHEVLFDAHSAHADQALGDGATREFILLHVFRISPILLTKPEDFWREAMRLHNRGIMLPKFLAEHVASKLQGTPLAELPIEEMLASKTRLARFVQDQWRLYLSGRGIVDDRASQESADESASPTVSIPFEHPDVRVLVDTMFLDGVLRPVKRYGSANDNPDWVSAGSTDDHGTQVDFISKGIGRIVDDLPATDASHRDWSILAHRLGDILFRFNALKAEFTDPVGQQVRELLSEADSRLKNWLFRNYADIPSLPVSNGPAMIHHVPRYLASRMNLGDERVALVVFDGMAFDQWIQMREHLATRIPGFVSEEGGCFAWLPTLTSVSRQALFSGLKPREFQSTIETTSREPIHWNRFWQDNGLRKSEIFFRKGLRRTEQLSGLEESISGPWTKVVGIVVDMIDGIVHGAKLGKRGIAGQIVEWCDTGFVEKQFRLFAKHGYRVYVTSDHGNVDAEGIGQLRQGVLADMKGDRVRAYRSEALVASSLQELEAAFHFVCPGLPSDLLPVFANGRGAFVAVGERIVAHGGISVEELIVPFARIDNEGKNS